MSTNEEDVLKRSRKDATVFLSAEKRRLDSLAKLCAADSICVAAAVIEGQLYISANELHQTSRDNNRCITAISGVIKHFNKIATKQAISSDERKKFFIGNVCSTTRSSELSNSKIILKKEEIYAIAEKITENPGFDISSMEGYEKHKADYSFVYHELRELYKGLTKLEEDIKKLADNQPVVEGKKQLTPEQFNTLRDKKVNILKEENKDASGENKEVHAEVQILSKIVKMVIEEKITPSRSEESPTTIYIGISKLCCLNCRVMLNAANEIFKDNRINLIIETRGQHDLNFGKWKCPDVFNEGYMTETIDTTGKDLAFQVGVKYKQEITKLQQLSNPSNISMEQDRSGSESKEVATAEDIGKNIKQLEGVINFLRDNLEQGNKPLSDVLDLAVIALTIHKLPSFRLFRESISSQSRVSSEEARQQLRIILPELNTIECMSNIKEPQIVEVLLNKAFVGVEVANYFKVLQFSDPKAFVSHIEHATERSVPILPIAESKKVEAKAVRKSMDRRDPDVPGQDVPKTKESKIDSAPNTSDSPSARNLH